MIVFVCEDFLATSNESQRDAKQARADFIDGMKAQLGGELEVAPKERKLGDGISSIDLWMTRDGEKVFAARLVTTALKGGASRFSMCGSRVPSSTGPAKCDRILELLSTEGPSRYLRPQVEPKFLGKKVAVPAGCNVDSVDWRFRITCGAVQLVVMELPQDTDLEAHVGQAAEAMRSAGGFVERAPKACKIGGASASCTVMGSDAKKSTAFFGAAVVESKPVYVHCAQPAHHQKPHALCEQLISF